MKRRTSRCITPKQAWKHDKRQGKRQDKRQDKRQGERQGVQDTQQRQIRHLY